MVKQNVKLIAFNIMQEAFFMYPSSIQQLF